ncbi:MAG: hypothetical protein AVDCRST_MAG03-2559 [uncultured Rubrobacteraceae bacterium]|uniref:Uncharacterized protein n=1 Tax=uncultured Rubrobacteraceae bacterium TaxID=349277 RepID=A0A6J4PNR5_9ACTN|nr:MAG: hypothetical protein AVDCRST_MAG03-2559 [uncultured Rubrobacteraceae bacterium]
MQGAGYAERHRPRGPQIQARFPDPNDEPLPADAPNRDRERRYERPSRVIVSSRTENPRASTHPGEIVK